MPEHDTQFSDEPDYRADLESIITWARTPTGTTVDEETLPAYLRDAIEVARAREFGADVTLAVRSISDGSETAHFGPTEDLPDSRSLVVVSIVTSYLTTTRVHTDADIIVFGAAQ